MKILHITTKSKGGAGIAALRLHLALQQSGVSSAYLSTDLTIDYQGDTMSDSFFNYKKPSFLRKIFRKIQILLVPTSFQKAKKHLSDLDDQLSYEMISLPYSVYDLNKHSLVQEADIINLHWVSGILDFDSFFRICKKPIVWTLHDMNPFLGLFHYNGDERINLDLVAELDTKIKNLKLSAIQNIENGVIITPSKWLLKKAKQSGVFVNFKKQKNIPNAIDFNIFKPLDKITLRKKRSIPLNDFVLLFITGVMECHRKGSDLLMEALTHLGHLPITVVAVGKGQLMERVKSIKIIPLGQVYTEEEMATCYALADVFILPSREDNLPNTMLESFACGIPVISFTNGGMKEYIKEDINGSKAEEISALSLANTIDRFYENKRAYNWIKIRSYAKNNFSFSKQAESYKRIYQKLLK